MQVILKKDIPQIGRIGELVKVREGYARNFLIPRNLAVAASASNVRQMDHQKRLVDLHKKKIQKESEKVAAKIKGTEVTIQRRVNESGKLFGTLTAAEIITELQAKEIVVDRRDIEVETIKAEGTYAIKVRLPGDVFTDVSLIVKGIQDAKETKKAAKGPKKPKAAASKKKDEEATEETASEE